MNSGIVEFANQLIQAVNYIMDPYADQQRRAEAYRACEDFKANSPYILEVGYILAGTQHSPVIRHFGLQLLEETIRYKWNDLEPSKKLWIKEKSVELVKSMLQHDQRHIKEALARILLEMVKREWPQQWPTMLPEMDELAASGTVQREVVLLLLLRLAEDVEVLQKVPNIRRRCLAVAMRESMVQILTFILTTLMDHFQAFTNKVEETEKSQHALVANTALETLGGYLEWASTASLEQCSIFQVLPRFLEHPVFRLEAARSLLALVSRKGKASDRIQLMSLFGQPMQYLFKSIVEVSSYPLNEVNYSFLKVAAQVLVGLGLQLCAVWEKSGVPENFSIFLQALLEVLNHPSQVISSFSPQLWTQLFIHKEISQRPEMKQVLPAFLSAAHSKLYRVGFPSATNSPSCDYSRLDFDDAAEFHELLSKLRAGVIDSIRHATVLDPVTCFQYCATCLRSMLAQPCPESVEVEEGEAITCQIWLQWDALGALMENITSKLFVHPEDPQPNVEEGIALIQSLLLYEIQDPELLSLALTCLSALLVFTTRTSTPDNSLLQPVLLKIFAAVTYNMPPNQNSPQVKKVRNLRKHACSLLLKLAKISPLFILPAFNDLKNFIFTLIDQEGNTLSFMEKGFLLEAIALVSSSLHNYQQQSATLHEILQPFHSYINSPEVSQALKQPQDLVNYLGLHQPISQIDEESSVHRSKISFLLNTISSVVRRTQCPKDIENCKKGGYLDGDGDIMNPLAPHILPLIPHILKLSGLLNSLWCQPNLLHSDWEPCLSMLQAEQNLLLGQKPTFKKSPLLPIQERVQIFLNNNDHCFTLLGYLCSHLGKALYWESSLPRLLADSFYNYLSHLPYFKVKIFLKTFMRPYIHHCPRNLLREHAYPLMKLMGPFMFEGLSSRWQQFKVVDEYSVEIEVMKDELNRQISREYLDLLLSILLDSRANSMEEETLGLSPLAVLIMEDPELRCCLIQTAYLALSWPDSQSCRISSQLCGPFFNHLRDAVGLGEGQYFLRAVIQGLQEHSQDDITTAKLVVLSVYIYETLRPKLPQMRDVFVALVKCGDPKALQELEDKLFNITSLPKAKSQAFKTFISKYIKADKHDKGKEEHFQNLGPIFSYKPKKPDMVDVSHDVGLVALFNS